jgi:HAD superfamily hydrolase (TIGR01509 family)
VFWDNDGVLVATEHLYFEATRRVLASAGVGLSDDDYVELFLRQNRGAWHLAESAGVPAHEIERLRHERDRVYAQLLAGGPHVIDGVADVLAALHGRVIMGVVTSSKREHFDIIHRDSGLLRYMDFVIAAGDYVEAKPHPEPYLKAIDISGRPAGACLAIEDSERGLAAATAAGLACVVVPTDLTRHCAFDGACHVAGDLRGVLALVRPSGPAARA